MTHTSKLIGQQWPVLVNVQCKKCFEPKNKILKRVSKTNDFAHLFKHIIFNLDYMKKSDKFLF